MQIRASRCHYLTRCPTVTAERNRAPGSYYAASVATPLNTCRRCQVIWTPSNAGCLGRGSSRRSPARASTARPASVRATYKCRDRQRRRDRPAPPSDPARGPCRGDHARQFLQLFGTRPTGSKRRRDRQRARPGHLRCYSAPRSTITTRTALVTVRYAAGQGRWTRTGDVRTQEAVTQHRGEASDADEAQTKCDDCRLHRAPACPAGPATADSTASRRR